MKTYNHLFESMLLPDTVAKCALDAAEGKLRRREVMSAFREFDKTYDHVVSCAKNPNYRPCEDNTHEIIDGANHKPREIEKPMFCPEQILHHMIIEPFKPVLLDGLYEQVYGCLPPTVKEGKDGRKLIRKYGPHAAIRQLRKWVQTGTKVFVAETDIHHAYGSVKIAILSRQMRRVIKDKEWLRITHQFLHYRPGNPADEELRGLILGHYTSPWFFNFYLKQFDHFAAALPGVKYLRFADNIFLVGTNKRKVHKALDAIREYLGRELELELNSCTQVYRFEYEDRRGKFRGRAVNALGAVIHCNRVTLRKSILMRIRRKSMRIVRKNGSVTWHDGASMFSRLSWIRHTDTYIYYMKYIKPNLNTRQLKQRVRNHSRKLMPIAKERRRIINDGLEKSARLSGREAAGVGHDNERGRCLPEEEHRTHHGRGYGREDCRTLAV